MHAQFRLGPKNQHAVYLQIKFVALNILIASTCGHHMLRGPRKGGYHYSFVALADADCLFCIQKARAEHMLHGCTHKYTLGPPPHVARQPSSNGFLDVFIVWHTKHLMSATKFAQRVRRTLPVCIKECACPSLLRAKIKIARGPMNLAT